MGKGSFGLILFVFLFSIVSQAKQFCSEQTHCFGIPAYVVYAEDENGKSLADDGTKLALIHLPKSALEIEIDLRLNKPFAGQVMLIEPGLISSHHMFSVLARELYTLGFEVFIGQTRLAGRDVAISPPGKKNGLEQVLLIDMPAHLRLVQRYATQIKNQDGSERKIHYIGHSMGGMEYLSVFSNPRLRDEFINIIGPATLLAAPNRLDKLQSWIQKLAHTLLPSAQWLFQKNIYQLKFQHQLFDWIKFQKSNGGFFRRHLAIGAEKTLAFIVSKIINDLLISEEHATEIEKRELVRRYISAIPIELLVDLGRAVLDNKGELLTPNFEKLIRPESTPENLDIQIIRAEKDVLVNWRDQEDLFHALPSKNKRLVGLLDAQHVDFIFERIVPFIVKEIKSFHKNPSKLGHSEITETFRNIDISSGRCMDLLFIHKH